jgi:Rieske Fe-S protein
MWIAGSLALLEGLVIAVPLIGSAIGPSFRRLRRSGWAKLALDEASLQVGHPIEVTFGDHTSDAYLRQDVLRHAWAVRQASGDIVVFSPICPHLGCLYNWDAPAGRFVCPCHGSQFGTDGKVLAGPAPRPLDPLPSRTQDGVLSVRWEQFKSGIATRELV